VPAFRVWHRGRLFTRPSRSRGINIKKPAILTGEPVKKFRITRRARGFRNRHRVILIQKRGYASGPAEITAPVMPDVRRTGCGTSPDGGMRGKKNPPAAGKFVTGSIPISF
jgi:hypothetical protein